MASTIKQEEQETALCRHKKPYTQAGFCRYNESRNLRNPLRGTCNYDCKPCDSRTNLTQRSTKSITSVESTVENAQATALDLISSGIAGYIPPCYE